MDMSWQYLTVKELIEIELTKNKKGYKLGCYNPKIDKVAKIDVATIVNGIDFEWTDIPVHIGKERYIVEVKTVDNEKDLDIVSYKEYKNRYGSDDEE